MTTKPTTLAQQAIFRTANSNEDFENLMTFLPIGRIRGMERLMHVMTDGSAVVIDPAADGCYALLEVAGCGGKIVTSSQRGDIVTATEKGGKAIAKGASSYAVAMGKGATATAMGESCRVIVGQGAGEIGKNGRATSTTKAGVLRGDVGSMLRWVDDGLAGGCLEITVGYGEGEACPNEYYGLGRNCDQWVITRQEDYKKD